eukprot:403375783
MESNSTMMEFMEIWDIFIDKNQDLIGRDPEEQNQLDSVRDMITDLRSNNLGKEECIWTLFDIYQDLNKIVEWYKWHLISDQGIRQKPIPRQQFQQQFQQNQANFQQQLHQEPDPSIFRFFGVDASLVTYKFNNQLEIVTQNITETTKIHEKADLFFYHNKASVSQQKKQYLCFGGKAHSQLLKMYQMCILTNESIDTAIETKVISKFQQPQINQLDENGNTLITGNVIIIEQQGNNNLDLVIFEPATKESDVTIRTQSARKWFQDNQMNQRQNQQQLDSELLKQLDKIYDLMIDTNSNQTLWSFKKLSNSNLPKKLRNSNGIPYKLLNCPIQAIKKRGRDANLTSIQDTANIAFSKSQQNKQSSQLVDRLNQYIPNQQFQQQAQPANSRLVIQQLQQHVQPNNEARIISIKKIFNESVYQIVESELNRLLVKHPDHAPLDLMNHLFHGTRQNDPQSIFSFENGLDMRYCNGGAHGIGIYFADNSLYSNTYKFSNAAGQSEMLMCLVLTGLSSNQGGGGGARQPAPIPGRQGELFDSYNNGNGGHFIIYDNQKAYPGYLITYT